ncbi:hypothetical protein, partial [Bradyrhizobium sp. NBAIM08]|uniref:hypothetical protein n=1 Tax=Bradyrhizobium sp. NBAIM08 TaxID=2793815 RepID=UPI001CD431B6
MAMLRRQYPDLAKETGFTPEDLQLLAEVLGENLSEAEVAARLGAARYQRWKEHATSVDTTTMVSALRTRLASTSEPLRDDQTRSLSGIILQERRRRDEEIRARGYATADPRAQLTLDMQALDTQLESERRVF